MCCLKRRSKPPNILEAEEVLVQDCLLGLGKALLHLSVLGNEDRDEIFELHLSGHDRNRTGTLVAVPY